MSFRLTFEGVCLTFKGVGSQLSMVGIRVEIVWSFLVISYSMQMGSGQLSICVNRLF